MKYPLELIEIIAVHGLFDKAVENVVFTYSKAHGIHIRSIECPMNNVSSCRNTGTLNSPDDIVALIDDDTAVDPFFPERAVTYLPGDDKLMCVDFLA